MARRTGHGPFFDRAWRRVDIKLHACGRAADAPSPLQVRPRLLSSRQTKKNGQLRHTMRVQGDEQAIISLHKGTVTDI